jgi:DNA-binding response OmpR family regulator
MSKRIGLLTSQNDVSDEAKSNTSRYEIIRYRSLDSLEAEVIDLLLIDVEFFEEEESIQFFLSKIRKKIHNLPVILVLKISHKDKLNFEWFFNDFICYPFRKGELELRIAKYIRLTARENESDVIQAGNITINLKEYSVYTEGGKIDITYKEFELLRLFLQNRGQAFSRKDLLSKIWGMEYIGGTRTVDVHIRRLRSKLGDEFNSLIETVRNVGYRCIK